MKNDCKNSTDKVARNMESRAISMSIKTKDNAGDDINQSSRVFQFAGRAGGGANKFINDQSLWPNDESRNSAGITAFTSKLQ